MGTEAPTPGDEGPNVHPVVVDRDGPEDLHEMEPAEDLAGELCLRTLDRCQFGEVAPELSLVEPSHFRIKRIVEKSNARRDFCRIVCW
jgi:hypothetical protein